MRTASAPALAVPWLCAALCVVLCGRGVLCAVPPQCPARVGSRCESANQSSSGEYIYKVDGHEVRVNYLAGAYYELSCDEATHSLEAPGLPRFLRVQRPRNVTLSRCAAPALPYARALAALNVAVGEKLKLLRLPGEPALRPDHFEGLAHLRHLEVQWRPGGPRPGLPAGAIARMPALQHLVVSYGGLGSPLPAGLVSLRRWFTGAATVAPAGTPHLTSLSVREARPVRVDVAGAPSLQALTISSPNSTLVRGNSTGSLRVLRIDYWADTRPEPWTSCQALEKLELVWHGPRGRLELPAGWVAECPALRELSIRKVALGPLPADLLSGASALINLTLAECGLEELPDTLLDSVPQLTDLNLSGNSLKSLESGPFPALTSLKRLDLSHNLVDTSAAQTRRMTLPLQGLQSLTELRELRLGYNPALGDLCNVGTATIQTIADSSTLNKMTKLQVLDLRGTAVTRVCRDWRRGMPNLRRLDLTDTRVALLQYEEVVGWNVADDARISIGGANTTLLLQYTAEDYRERAVHGRGPPVALELRSPVFCDCTAYWAALVFRTDARHAHLAAPACLGGARTLADVPLDGLTCSADRLCGADAMRPCTCDVRPDNGTEGKAATARCERAGLAAVPGPLPPGYVWRLLLAHNRIERVRAADLPPHLREIDLTDNALATLDDETAPLLLGRRVRLARNPLRCDCGALPLVRELAANRTLDHGNVTCRGGERLPAPDRLAAECAPTPPVTVAVAISLLLGVAAGALALTVLLASAEARLRMKIVLERLGWLSPPIEEDGDGGEGGEGGGPGAGVRRYDAFVSHAHEDEEWVRELVARLEAGGHRVCVHYRDWAPGEWIPAQIAASVRASRRTLAVVSRHFLRSAWARLEFREAQVQARRDATPRLVVLLLEEPAQLELDAEMRAFIENNTYVHKGDPWFWKKLEHAMPRRPRRRRRPPAPAPAPAPGHESAPSKR